MAQRGQLAQRLVGLGGEAALDLALPDRRVRWLEQSAAANSASGCAPGVTRGREEPCPFMKLHQSRQDPGQRQRRLPGPRCADNQQDPVSLLFEVGDTARNQRFSSKEAPAPALRVRIEPRIRTISGKDDSSARIEVSQRVDAFDVKALLPKAGTPAFEQRSECATLGRCQWNETTLLGAVSQPLGNLGNQSRARLIHRLPRRGAVRIDSRIARTRPRIHRDSFVSGSSSRLSLPAGVSTAFCCPVASPSSHSSRATARS